MKKGTDGLITVAAIAAIGTADLMNTSYFGPDNQESNEPITTHDAQTPLKLL